VIPLPMLARRRDEIRQPVWPRKAQEQTSGASPYVPFEPSVAKKDCGLIARKPGLRRDGHVRHVRLKTIRRNSSVVFGKVFAVARQQGCHVIGHEVDFSPDGFDFTRLQPAEPEVRMEAAGDALKQFLVRLPSRGKDEGLIPAETADQAVAGNQCS